MTKSGFALPQILIFVLSLTVVAGGYLVLKPEVKNQEISSDQNSTSTIADPDISNWQTYRNEKYNLEFKYPAGWIAKDYIYGNVVMQAEGKTENSGFQVYKEGIGNGGQKLITNLIIWGGPQSQGDTCESMKERFQFSACADIGEGKVRKGMYLTSNNPEAKEVFNGILSTLKFIK
jgi:hypothetical protein